MNPADAATRAMVIRRGARRPAAQEYAHHLLYKVKLADETVWHEMKRWNDGLEEPLSPSEIGQVTEDAILHHRNNPKAEQPDSKQQLLGFMQGKILKTIISANDPTKVYCIVESSDIKQTMELGSSDAAEWLIATYHKETGNIISYDACSLILGLLKAKAKIEGVPSETVYQRIALVDGTLYYDLCNSLWELVRVAPDSIRIVRHGVDTPMFQRNPNQTAQVTPELGASPDSIEEMCRLLRMDTLLFKVHLVSFFVESIQTPIILITGQQGSIKSTQSGLIKRMVDPTGSALEDNLSNFPKKLDDLCLRLLNELVIAFDNVSMIPAELSDILCTAVTGTKNFKRQLYKDALEVIMRIKRKIVINGIALGIERVDLIERTVVYQTSAVPRDQRKTAAYVEEQFTRILPWFLGSVFGVLQEAIRMRSSVEESIPDSSRMMDFEIWGECISRAMGNSPGAFQMGYEQSIKDSNDLLSEGIPLVPFLLELHKDRVKVVMTVKEFFLALKRYAEENQYDVKSRSFPKSPNRLRWYIARFKTLLDEVGISVGIDRNTETNEFTKNSILIETRSSYSPSSPSSPPTGTGRDRGEGGEHGEGTLEEFS